MSQIPNFRFDELQVAVPEDLNACPDWDLTPIRSITSLRHHAPPPVGKTMVVRVRTVHPKGPSPRSAAVASLVL